jgi:hypothetical protein
MFPLAAHLSVRPWGRRRLLAAGQGVASSSLTVRGATYVDTWYRVVDSESWWAWSALRRSCQRARVLVTAAVRAAKRTWKTFTYACTLSARADTVSRRTGEPVVPGSSTADMVPACRDLTIPALAAGTSGFVRTTR